MAKKKRTVALLIKVTVPAEMSDVDARREVRALINCQCNYSASEGDVKIVACNSAAVSA